AGHPVNGGRRGLGALAGHEGIQSSRFGYGSI
ncbi:hypothetical protein A2U01_0101146, partial [Trifolium medium]|nr:hypothetical protein [Trifolium medium]